MTMALHGVLLIDKPSGCTSHDVVARARKLLNTKSVGHSGTLDPLASGLLVLLIGEGTKLSDYLLTGDKSYSVTVKLGTKTDSDDITGEVLSTRPVTCSHEEIELAIEKLSGDLELVPPIFSAIKVNGQKLYEKGRKQRQDGSYDLSQISPRQMSFYNISLESFAGDQVKISMDCSKGSYVRAWARELGELLKCGACVQELRRNWSEPFSVDRSITLDELEKNKDNVDQLPAFIPLKDALIHFDSFSVLGEDEKWIRNGQITTALFSSLIRRYPVYSEAPQGLRVVSGSSGKLVSIFIKEPGQGFRIKRVFNY